MIFNIEWVIQNPIQTIDKGVSVIFDSEPILLAATIITFLIVAFFVWNKNKVKLYKMVSDRQPMEPVRIDKDDLLELKSALGKATISEESVTPVRLSERPSAKGQVPPERRSGEATKGTMAIPSNALDADIRPSDPVKADEPRYDEFRERETDNAQHSYEEPKKIDKRKTPEFKARLLENLRKARERKRLEKAGREVPKKSGK